MFVFFFLMCFVLFFFFFFSSRRRHTRSYGDWSSDVCSSDLAWAETPSNPLLKVVDLAAVAEIVHDTGTLLICDNTWAPVLQRPFDLGADLILHSTTKYFGGHCDVLGGILVAKTENDFVQRIRSIQYEAGAVPSPFDCWLILRGMRT